jgi:hypothetical protein
VVYRPLQDAGEALETTLALACLHGSESPAAQRFIQLATALALP